MKTLLERHPIYCPAHPLGQPITRRRRHNVVLRRVEDQYRFGDGTESWLEIVESLR